VIRKYVIPDLAIPAGLCSWWLNINFTLHIDQLMACKDADWHVSHSERPVL